MWSGRKGVRAFGLAVVILLASVVGAGAQVADTVRVTIEGDLAVARIQIPDTTVAIGDTIFFTAEAVDSEGDPVSAMFSWASSDPAVLSIDEVTGIAVALGKTAGWVEVYLLAQRVSEVRLASFRGGALNWSGNDTIQTGESLQYCAYLLNGETVVAEDPGSPICPNLGPPAVPFAAYAMFGGFRSGPPRRPLLRFVRSGTG